MVRLQIPTGARSPGVYGPLMDFGRCDCLGFKGKIWSEMWLPSLAASVRLTALIVGNAPLGGISFRNAWDAAHHAKEDLTVRRRYNQFYEYSRSV